MEKENKTTQPTNNHHRNKSRKHKSYFMTPSPASQTGDTNAQQPPKTSPEAPQNNQNKNHHNHNNHNNHNKATPQVVTDANATKGNVPQAAEQKSNHPQHSQNKHNKNRHHKRHTDMPRDNQQNATNAPVSTEAPTPVAKPENSAPISAQVNTKRSVDRLEKPAPKKLEKLSDSADSEKYSEYEEFTYDQIYGDKNIDTTIDATDSTDSQEKVSDVVDEPMVDVVGIRFKASGKTYYFSPKGIFLKPGSHAIVETARGLEYGEVALGNTKVKESETVPPLRPVVRMASEADIKHHAENKKKEEDAFRLCNERIIQHELDMKLIDAQYTFDNSKLLFYFTSSGRVDFRDLVKDLAGIFRTRIELRQIGIRDEAKMVGGLGPCGRPLCCSIFLTDFGQVSIKMAKEQNLSLNSTKISGICGRLMCCLRYEHETYEYEIKRTPPVDTLVRTTDGVGVVTEISPLAGTIKVRLNESPETPPKSYKREDVSILRKKK